MACCRFRSQHLFGVELQLAHVILELYDELNVAVAAGHRVLISVIQLAHAAALNFSTLEECYDFFEGSIQLLKRNEAL